MQLAQKTAILCDCQIARNDGILPFKVTQGHRFGTDPGVGNKATSAVLAKQASKQIRLSVCLSVCLSHSLSFTVCGLNSESCHASSSAARELSL